MINHMQMRTILVISQGSTASSLAIAATTSFGLSCDTREAEAIVALRGMTESRDRSALAQ